MPDEIKNVRVVRIGRSNLSQVQSIFYNAYKDNELFREILNARHRGYEQRLRGFIHEELLLHFSGSNISLALSLDDRLVGAVLVSRPEEPLNIATSWRWRLGMWSVAGITATERYRRYFDQIHNTLGRLDHYWISLIALHPDFQHHGYGHRLVDAMHVECERDTHFHGVSVDTCDPQTIHFFETLGYSQVGEVALRDVNQQILYHPRTGEGIAPLETEATAN